MTRRRLRVRLRECIALYGELLVSPTESELETKVILDKQVGNLLLAANLVGEFELEYDTMETEPEVNELLVPLRSAPSVRTPFATLTMLDDAVDARRQGRTGRRVSKT